MNPPLSELLVRVVRKQPVAMDIALFELAPAEGQALPPFAAGAHIDVHVPSGQTRQYSLCNDPRESHRYQIAVLRDPGSRGGSQGMHEQVQEGQTLRISAPKNHFPLIADAPKSLFLAGGIGVTPLMSMAAVLGAHHAAFDFHYCARSPERAAFVEQLRGATWGDRLHLHFDDGPEAQRLNLEALLSASSDGLHLYTCGPKGFMDAVLAQARRSGWRESQLHCEFFGAAPAASTSDRAFEVELASTGQVVLVEAGQSIAAALASEGVSVPVSCEQGVCGTCLTRVLAGTPDHRDVFLMPEEQSANEKILLCCSRAKTARLVLDL
jgi:vanillate O-demethylase ferredoxin subunit